MKNVLKLSILPIESVFIIECDVGLKVKNSDFDLQITTSKMILILILNHLYLSDLILILKSSTYDDFAHLCGKEYFAAVGTEKNTIAFVTHIEISCKIVILLMEILL